MAALGASVTLPGCLSLPSVNENELGPILGDWSMDGGGPGHARYAETGPVDPETVWEREFDSVRAVGTPSLGNDRLYAPADAVTEQSRSRYRLYALETGAGEVRWHVPMRAEPNGSPAVEWNRIVVSAKRSLERGRLLGFEPKYGGESWLYDVDARLTAPPTVDDGYVYVGDWSGTVHVLDVRSGEPRWRRRIDADDGGRTFTGAGAVHDGTLFLGSQSGNTGLVALYAGTGNERWRASTGPVTVGPVANGDLVLVGSHGLATAFGLDGTRRWSFNVPAESGRPMAVDEKRVYVPGRETLYAVSRDGEEAWRADDVSGTPTVAGDAVIVREEGSLRGFDAADGTERWSVSVDGVGEAVVDPRAVFLSTGARVQGLSHG